MTAGHTIDQRVRRFLAASQKDGTLVTQSFPQISPLTTSMLAVRDRRDRAAFAELFDHFAPRLKGFIMRSGTPSGQAEEIVQEVMLTVWSKAAQFDPQRAQVSAWIYQIARNRQIDLIRKERRPVPEDWEMNTGTEDDPGMILEVEQEVGRLKLALAQLNANQREMIEKAYMGELSHQAISTLTGLPLGTIKSRIRLGLERLRRELKDIRLDDRNHASHPRRFVGRICSWQPAAAVRTGRGDPYFALSGMPRGT